MVDFHSVTVFGVNRITLTKGQRDDHKWVSINLGDGCSITVFKNPGSTDWPEVAYEHHTITVAVEEETAEAE